MSNYSTLQQPAEIIEMIPGIVITTIYIAGFVILCAFAFYALRKYFKKMRDHQSRDQ